LRTGLTGPIKINYRYTCSLPKQKSNRINEDRAAVIVKSQ